MLKSSLIFLISLFWCGIAAFSQTEEGKTVVERLGEEFNITLPSDSNDQPSESNPTVDTEEDTPVVLESMEMKPDELGRRPWQAPDYSKQTGVLGYSADTFKVPAGLEPQVDFWVKIFSKYSTEQGLLHDSRYINLVYTELDFTKIDNYAGLNPSQRQRARERLVKEKKKEISERLKRLALLKSSEGLEGEDLRYWKMFETVDEPRKFYEAAQKGRLRFQLGQKDRFIQGIYYSGRYLSKMEGIFAESGLPIELTRLPFVESSFNLKARSKVGASGIWQFMRHTGRIYMKVGSVIDERNDPLIATAAATRLLKFNYNLLQSWPLAVTAYNFGPSGMKREKDRHRTDNLVEIARKSTNKRFGFASSNFYASFLAVLEVERNADKYFGKVEWSNPLDFDEVVLPKVVRFGVLLDHFGGDQDRAMLYNPHFSTAVRKGFVGLPKGIRLRLPKSSGERFLASLSSVPERKEAPIATGTTEYRVAQGDTLSGIAREFGVRVNDLIEINGLDNPRGLRVGQRLQIPVAGQ